MCGSLAGSLGVFSVAIKKDLTRGNKLENIWARGPEKEAGCS